MSAFIGHRCRTCRKDLVATDVIQRLTPKGDAVRFCRACNPPSASRPPGSELDLELRLEQAYTQGYIAGIAQYGEE